MFRSELKISTEKRFTNITMLLNNIILNSGVKRGIMHIFVKHTTCGVKILENELLSIYDITEFIEEQVPDTRKYAHNRLDLREVPPEERINADSHIKMLFISNSETIPISKGSLCLGDWQDIFIVEMDYKPPFRERKVVVTIIEGGKDGTS